MQYFGWRKRRAAGSFCSTSRARCSSIRIYSTANWRKGASWNLGSLTAQKIVFSWVDLSANKTYDPHQVHFTDPDDGFYHVWTASVDGSELKQITSGSFDDITPTFLPDGSVAFSSTRRRGHARCFWWGFGKRWQVYTLHRMNADGSNIQTLSWHDTNEWFPEVTNDGRIVYARWDYIDRDAVTHQNLWTTRPDGTNPAALWGNATPSPHCSFQARAIPNSRKYVFTASAHHSCTAGSIVLVDPSVALDGEEALARVTPEVKFPEAESRYSNTILLLFHCRKNISTSPIRKRLRWEGEPPQTPTLWGSIRSVFWEPRTGLPRRVDQRRCAALLERRAAHGLVEPAAGKRAEQRVYVGRQRLQGLRG